MCARKRPLRRRGSALELGDGGIDVVEVEYDVAAISFVGVDLDDAERIDMERLGLAVAARKRCERGRGAPAGRDDGRRYVHGADVGGGLQVRDRGISTSRTPAFTTRRRSSMDMSSASSLGEGIPVAGRKVRHVALDHLACAFSSRVAAR